MTSYNIYCDESCHLLNDKSKVFALGGIWVEKSETETVLKELRKIKTKHNLSTTFEAKWTKISKSKEDYYCDMVKYFFDNDKLHFRAVVVPDKTILDHATFNQDHDTWYYKMFYLLLSRILQPDSDYNLYLDKKDLELLKVFREIQKQDMDKVRFAQTEDFTYQEFLSKAYETSDLVKEMRKRATNNADLYYDNLDKTLDVIKQHNSRMNQLYKSHVNCTYQNYGSSGTVDCN